MPWFLFVADMADAVTLADLIALYHETDSALGEMSRWRMMAARDKPEFRTKEVFQNFLDSHRLG